MTIGGTGVANQWQVTGTLTFYRCLSLANKDHRRRNSSKQQHYPCFANRGLLRIVLWVAWVWEAISFVIASSAWVIGVWNVRISRVATTCGWYAVAVSSARNHAGRRGKWLIHRGLVRIVGGLLKIIVVAIRRTICCASARVVWRVMLCRRIHLRRDWCGAYQHKHTKPKNTCRALE